ncbi:unnamed protein product, partial [Candidula unifasciata]
VLFLGDSNGREIYRDFISRSSCKVQISEDKIRWHKPLKCANESLNLTMEWFPHSHPFYTDSDAWADNNWITAANKVIDAIPSNGRHFVYINHFLHLTSTHISAYVAMMTAIKESIKRLLMRNPDCFLVII